MVPDTAAPDSGTVSGMGDQGGCPAGLATRGSQTQLVRRLRLPFAVEVEVRQSYC